PGSQVPLLLSKTQSCAHWRSHHCGLTERNFYKIPPGDNTRRAAFPSGHSPPGTQDHSLTRVLLSLSPPLLFCSGCCYQAATRTGQTSPIGADLGGSLSCGFLWGSVVRGRSRGNS